jgi:hypothetical protein
MRLLRFDIIDVAVMHQSEIGFAAKGAIVALSDAGCLYSLVKK